MIPDPVVETGNEDTQAIDDDIDSLYSRFIAPIEKIRSTTASVQASSVTPDQQDQLRSNLTLSATPVESRAHAFYRMLGFPIVDSQGRLYNGGFNPAILDQDTRTSINQSQDTTQVGLQSTRETTVQYYASVYVNQDLISSMSALFFGLHPKPFNVFTNPNQTYSVPDRTLELEAFQITNTNLTTQLTAALAGLSTSILHPTMDGGTHVLSPFTVNPALEITTMPVNQIIAAPFLLDKNAVRSSASPEMLHLRPGIELILRQRLSDTTPDPFFLNNLQNVLTQANNPNPTFASDLDPDTLQETLEAFAGSGDISSLDLNTLFSNLSTTETQMIETLVKTIKVLIDKLRDDVVGLEVVRTKFNFIPVPGIRGPEQIGAIQDAQPTSQLDLQILQMQIKQLIGDQAPIMDPSLGDFASPFSKIQKTQTFSDQQDTLSQKRNRLGKLALGYLREIEIITGEVSGLGLIDILAIYLALWSMDLSDVLGFLDQDSFNRLYNNNPSLRNGPLAAQQKSSVTTALQNLTTTVTNVLTFADKLYNDSISSPTQTEGGLFDVI